MNYHLIGSGNLKVSELCLGTMTFGRQNTEAQAYELLSHAVDHGINFIDTAELYPAPVRADTTFRTEEIIGKWLKHHQRDQLFIGTKVVGPAPKKWIGHIRGGPQLTEQQIVEALEGSLKRLNTDYIDLYQVHWPARKTNYFGKLGYEVGRDRHDTPIAETVATLARLQHSGKIRAVGISNETPWGVHSYLSAARQQGVEPIVSIQNPYSLLNRTFEIGLAEFCHRDSPGLLAYSPLACGTLSGKYLNGLRPEKARLTLFENYFYKYTIPAVNEAVSRYVEIAKRYGHEPAAMALAFVRQQPFVTSTIIGATSTTQLASNIKSLDTTLCESCMKEIQQTHLSNPNPCP